MSGALLSLLLLGELGARLSLFLKAARVLRQASDSFRVFTDSLYAYDEEFGYRYIPGKESTVFGIAGDQVRFQWRSAINEDGNVGEKTPLWNGSRLKILVGGDSCTANPVSPDGPIAWTDSFPALLEGRIHKKVGLRNYGRDGYGLLMMVHLAVQMAKRTKPDMILIAFIEDDLTRARFWRTTVATPGAPRVLTMISPQKEPVPGSACDTVFVDERAARLAEAGPASRKMIIAELRARLLEIGGSHLKSYFLSCTESFLLDLVRSSAFRGISWRGRTPRVPADIYERDPLFQRDLGELKKLAVPVLFYCLPTYGQLEAGLPCFNQELAAPFLRELGRFGFQVSPIPWPRKEDIPRFPGLFLLPNDGRSAPGAAALLYDNHPSKRGAVFLSEFLAQAVASAIRRRAR